MNLASGWVKHTATGMVTFPDPDQVGHPSTLLSSLGGRWAMLGGSLVGLGIVVGLAFAVRRSRRIAAAPGQ